MKRRLKCFAAASALAAAAFGSATAYAQGHEDDGDDSDNEIILPHRGDIDPFRGDIDPFQGDINPFRGDINPFYGDISPFWGDISPFWGDIDPFQGDINPFHGDISPFWGDIDPFTGEFDPFWEDIAPFLQEMGPEWGDLNELWRTLNETGEGGEDVAARLRALFERADAVFGDAIEARTGDDMHAAFLNALMERFGINPDDPDSLADVDVAARSEFFLVFYDSLMGFTGVDHIDHWMPAIGWSPALADRYRNGSNVTVGLVDFSVARQEEGRFWLRQGNWEYMDFNHGAAVASLIGAPVDGFGIMGVAPETNFLLYNPFDESLTANWDDVGEAVAWLTREQSDVINLSLGVYGWTLHPGWADAFSELTIQLMHHNTTYVVAAGNDGSTQTTDVDWTGVGVSDNLIIVGSVNPLGNISSFSNRPGTACLTVRGVCQDGMRLMDRFLVAPGELLLVSDGSGGVVRMSGTSFAAPLVSGAAALVAGEWQWLDGGDVADVLLRSARDLGEPGADPVYGRGMLDVSAAMAPLDADDLFVLTWWGRKRSATNVALRPGRLQFFGLDSRSVTVFEPLNWTFRDFTIPLEELVQGENLAEGVENVYAERYIYERHNTDASGAGFTDMGGDMRVIARRGSLDVSAHAAAPDMAGAGVSNRMGFQAAIRMTDRETGDRLEFGVGEGAVALSGEGGFGLFSDHRPETGGVNPVLGFASGGVYAAGRMALSDQTSLHYGVTSTVEEYLFVMPGTGEERPVIDGMAPYQAAAMNIALHHQLNDRVSFEAGFTQLHEATGLLGAQGAGPLAMEGGADTSAVTLGFHADLPFALSLSGSGTAAQTYAQSFAGDMLAVSDSIQSTAGQLSLGFDGFERFNDGMRLSVIQPLHAESGALTYQGMRVVNRETGELGQDQQVWSLGGARPVYAEFLYAAPIGGEMMDINFFARELIEGEDTGAQFGAAAAGVSVQLRF